MSLRTPVTPIHPRNSARHHCHGLAWLGLGIAMTLACLMPGMRVASAGDDVSFEPNWYMLVDRAGLLDEGQGQSAANDAWRFNMIGVPTQVVTENAGLSQAQANARANELRLANEIESAAGADDGLLVYAAVDPQDRANIVIAISAGANTLPRNGLTITSIADVQRIIVMPQLESGHPARAIVYSLRQMIYLEQYVPPAVEPLAGWRHGMQRVLAFLGPVLAMFAMAWILAIPWRGQPDTRLRQLIAAGAIAVVLAAAALLARSAPTAIATVALALVVTWGFVRHDGQGVPDRRRTIVATPRPPRPVPRPIRTRRP